ncbi:MAG: hypothetical protein HY815_05055 [Candidatus Riflebacteria bacterium]|nr:hypothetical protein [Candidatus Riflebacteria bacterium]
MLRALSVPAAATVTHDPRPGEDTLLPEPALMIPAPDLDRWKTLLDHARRRLDPSLPRVRHARSAADSGRLARLAATFQVKVASVARQVFSAHAGLCGLEIDPSASTAALETAFPFTW